MTIHRLSQGAGNREPTGPVGCYLKQYRNSKKLIRKGQEMRQFKSLLAVLAVLVTATATSYSHCQIPCGIYDDSARIAAMREDVTTIEKSMNGIIELSAAGEKNYNQIVRWVMNKEDHADKLQEVATQYFMFQRIKPVDETDQVAWTAYQQQLTLMHKITVHAMKAKQTTDLAEVETLRSLIDAFEKLYFGK
jgi:nickel superoxide dismutase